MTIRLRQLGSLLALVAAGACATMPPPTLQTGPDREVTVDGLVRVDNSRVPFAYLKPDIDLSPYSRYMLDPVEVSYKKDPGERRSTIRNAGGDQNFALSAQQMEDFREEFEEAVERALTADGGYELATAPAPDVLRITASLLDLEVRVPTDRLGSERQFTRSYGEVSLVIELRDSQSGEVLLRAGERRDPTRNTDMHLAEVTTASVRADVRAMFRYWAELLRQRLDEVREAPEALTPGAL